MSDLTPWEEINPTALVQRHEQHSRSLARLEPADSDHFRNELTACLALVVPVGMTEEGRSEWLSVAWATLNHLPADLLSLGCKKARETCDHPSKIVPTIISETRESMESRRNSEREYRVGEPPKELPRPNYVTPEEAAEILREVGLKPKRVNG